MAKEKKHSNTGRSVGQRIVSIVGILLCVIFIPLIVVNLVLVVKSYMDEERIPTVFGVAPVICLSGSMEPEFSTGDMIFIQEVDTETLQVGDVICFIPYGSDAAVTHRIIETQINGGLNTFITRGDANNTEDRTPVSAPEVQGKYTGVHIPGLGDLALFMQTTTGMIVFIVVPLLLFVLWDVVRRAVASRKKAGSKQELEAELERLRAQVSENSAQEYFGDSQQSAAEDNHTYAEAISHQEPDNNE